MIKIIKIYETIKTRKDYKMLNCAATTIVCVDLQEKLINLAKNNDVLIKNASALLNCASILNIDAIITEQYPKGLGQTIEGIRNIIGFDKFKKFEKTSFSFLNNNDFNYELKKDIIIFGIETHICVFQSVLDLIKKGHNVYVALDCCASKNKIDHKTSLNLMKDFGAKIITSQIVLFEFLKDSRHPNFKEIQALIK